MDWLQFENNLIAKGYENICGVDEAGRGPLAGPVCAAAVILPHDTVIEGVNDSKKLSEKKREQLYDVIIEKAIACSVAFGTNEEIDRINILQCTLRTMKKAVDGLSIKPDYVIIDGNKIPELDIPAEYIVKGDARSMSIACASILAKVSRDRLMYRYAEKYPEYHFEKHKGYGTKLHTQAILENGPCEIHRMTFLKKLYNKETK